MSHQVIYLSDLSSDLDEAVIREWYVSTGETCSQGEPLLAFETAKTIMEAPMPQTGTIEQCHAQPGETITPETALLTIHHAD